MKDVTVTLTLDDIKLYDRARAIGLPSIVISMYRERIKKLLAEERESEREACAEIAEKEMRNTAMLTSNPPKSAAAWDIRNAIRARGEV